MELNPQAAGFILYCTREKKDIPQLYDEMCRVAQDGLRLRDRAAMGICFGLNGWGRTVEMIEPVTHRRMGGVFPAIRSARRKDGQSMWRALYPEYYLRNERFHTLWIPRRSSERAEPLRTAVPSPRVGRTGIGAASRQGSAMVSFGQDSRDFGQHCRPLTPPGEADPARIVFGRTAD